MIVSAASLGYAAGFLSWLVLWVGAGGAGVSRRIAASTATAAGSSMRSGSPCRARERRASSAPAWRMAARSPALIATVAGRSRSSVLGGFVGHHPLPW